MTLSIMHYLTCLHLPPRHEAVAGPQHRGEGAHRLRGMERGGGGGGDIRPLKRLSKSFQSGPPFPPARALPSPPIRAHLRVQVGVHATVPQNEVADNVGAKSFHSRAPPPRQGPLLSCPRPPACLGRRTRRRGAAGRGSGRCPRAPRALRATGRRRRTRETGGIG